MPNTENTQEETYTAFVARMWKYTAEKEGFCPREEFLSDFAAQLIYCYKFSSALTARSFYNQYVI